MKRPKNDTVVHVEPLEVSSKAILFEQVADWIRLNRNLVFYGIIGLLLGTILFTQWAARSEKAQVSDYLRAPSAYQEFARPEGNFENLRNILHSTPNLKEKYAPLIAQSFLLKGNTIAAEPYSRVALSTLDKEGASSLKTFTENSLLISEGKLSEALLESKKLQALYPAFETPLSVTNALRIVGLYHALGDSAGEKQSIKTLIDANSSVDSPKTLRRILSKTRIGSTSLESYIKLRHDKLSS